MTETEQNEFWLQYNFVFKPHSSLESIMHFVGKSSFNGQVECCVCHACDSIDIVQEEETADVICESCGVIQKYPAHFVNGRISEGYQYTTKKCYTRMDHLKSILIELQCGRSKEICDIGQDVHEFLLLKKRDVNFKNARSSLRKLGYFQHYLHLPSILNFIDPKLFKAWKPSHGSVERILGLFNQYQEHFENYLHQHPSSKRKNSLNYHFILEKLFGMIDDEDVPFRFLHGPKGKKSILEHELIWKNIGPRLIHFDYMKY